MKILALETTTSVCSVAVLEDETCLACETLTQGNTHSETLLPLVQTLLERLKLSVAQIDAFAFANGPGSFTGIRIGCATVKGLAFGQAKPCVEVSALEALAENYQKENALIIPVINARRDQVYASAYLNGKRVLADCCIVVPDLVPILNQYPNEKYFLGDGYEMTENRGFENRKETPSQVRLPDAYSVGKVAYRKIKNGDAVSDRELKVNYLRKPQAEQEREERLKNQ